MLENWLKPLPATTAQLSENLSTASFGKNIALHLDAMPDLRQSRIALIGLAEKEAAEVRRHLYPMAWAFPENSFADLGDARKSDTSFLVPLVYELLSGGVLPILIGGGDHLAPAQFLAYQEAKALVNLAVVDERLTDTYNNMVSPRHPSLFHLGLIGLQIHQTSLDLAAFLEKQNFDVLRLGKTRPGLEEAEPVLRDADLLAFHLAALKQAEAPGVAGASPAGFFSEEACQLCRYAGMSDKLTSFGIYGFQHARDRDGQTAQVIAQMVWYFTEGFFSRKNDFPASTDGLTEYIVEMPSLHYQITFWKSVKSGRWWMQVPVATQRKHQRHRLVPCSYQDYQAAIREELPERLSRAFARFG
jgi:formiminoglutamase